MKHIAFTLLFTVNSALAQPTYLTNRQVYDFSVGDVFQVEQTYYAPFTSIPPDWVTRTVLDAKRHHDSFIYVVGNYSYTPAVPPWKPTIFTSVDTVVIRQLDSAVNHYNFTSKKCYHLVSSMSKHKCGRDLWKLTPVWDTFCFEPMRQETFVVAGVWGIYGAYSQPGAGGGSGETRLIAYRKVGEPQCGTFITAGIGEAHGELSLRVYPQPASDEVRIDPGPVHRGSLRVSIRDLSGRCVATSLVSADNSWKMDISGVPEGIYLVHLEANDMRSVVKLVIDR